MSFTSKPKEIVFNVSYEGNSDEFLFEEMDNLVNADLHDYQHPDEQGNHSWTQKLTGAPNSQVGSVLSIPVGPGDKISAEVFAKYIDTDTASNPSALIASLLTTAFTGGTGINNELTNQAINTSFNGGSFITNPANNQTYDANGVMAFLNLLFLPEEAQATVSQEHFAFQQVNTSATSHEQLSINNFIAPKAGYVLVYLSNEDPTYTEVFFDDLKITLNEHPVIQMDSYYPFGLTHSNGYQRVTNLKNRFLYNEGTERIEALDLGIDFTKFRTYDPSLGRWNQPEPLADYFTSITPYTYAFNNPLYFNDPLGLSPETDFTDFGIRDNVNLNTSTGEVTVIETDEPDRFFIDGEFVAQWGVDGAWMSMWDLADVNYYNLQGTTRGLKGPWLDQNSGNNTNQNQFNLLGYTANQVAVQGFYMGSLEYGLGMWYDIRYAKIANAQFSGTKATAQAIGNGADKAPLFATRFASGSRMAQVVRIAKVAGPVASGAGIALSGYKLVTGQGDGWDVADIAVNGAGLVVTGLVAAAYLSNPVGWVVGAGVLAYNGYRLYQSFNE